MVSDIKPLLIYNLSEARLDVEFIHISLLLYSTVTDAWFLKVISSSFFNWVTENIKKVNGSPRKPHWNHWNVCSVSVAKAVLHKKDHKYFVLKWEFLD